MFPRRSLPTVPPGARFRLLAPLFTLVLLVVMGTPAAAQTAPPAGQAEAERLAASLESRYVEMERLSERLNASTEQSKRLAGSVSTSERRLATLKAELATAQADLDRRARSAYITGAPGFLGPILDAVNPAEAVQRSRMVGGVLAADAAAVDKVSAAKGEAERVAAELGRAAAEQRARVAAATTERRELEAMTRQLEAELAQADPAVLAAVRAGEERNEAGRRGRYEAWVASVGGSDGMSAGARALAAVQWAMARRGTPYRWGGTGPSGFDCSGLTMAAYRAAGIGIPRVSRDQFGAGARIAFADLLPGDLVFYGSGPGNVASIHHVGMYIGRGLMVHAPHSGDVVRTASVWRSGVRRRGPAGPGDPHRTATPEARATRPADRDHPAAGDDPAAGHDAARPQPLTDADDDTGADDGTGADDDDLDHDDDRRPGSDRLADAIAIAVDRLVRKWGKGGHGGLRSTPARPTMWPPGGPRTGRDRLRRPIASCCT